ncbi:hypothetical protein QBC36DRAFT_363282 [Triangularia setosa]|uniref:Uncharacterized protein n=1 Tax=Triangularia setosa TaxID=2587417 RepID=A0AAN6W0T1_9PEZI|nr:hypothetical protein QBC36DRAFT_363282 [Podospora setosa]
MPSSSKLASAPTSALALAGLAKNALAVPDLSFPPRTPSLLLGDRALDLIPTLADLLVKPGCRTTGLPLPPMPERTRAHKRLWTEFIKSWMKETDDYSDLETAHRNLKAAHDEGTKSRNELRQLKKWFDTCKKRWLEHRASNKNNAIMPEAYRAFEELLKKETSLIQKIAYNDTVLPKQEKLQRLIEEATKSDLRGLVDLWNNRVNWADRFNQICNDEIGSHLEEQDRLDKEEEAREAARMEAWRKQEEAQNAAKMEAFTELSDRLRDQEEATQAARKEQKESNEARKKPDEAEAEARAQTLIRETAREMRQLETAACNINAPTVNQAGIVDTAIDKGGAFYVAPGDTQQLDGEWERGQALLRLEHQVAERKRTGQLEREQEMRKSQYQAQQQRAAQSQTSQNQASQNQASQRQPTQPQFAHHQAEKQQASQHQPVQQYPAPQQQAVQPHFQQHQDFQHPIVQHQASQDHAAQNRAIQRQELPQAQQRPQIAQNQVFQRHQPPQYQNLYHYAAQYQASPHQASQHNTFQHSAVQQTAPQIPRPPKVGKTEEEKKEAKRAAGRARYQRLKAEKAERERQEQARLQQENVEQMLERDNTIRQQQEDVHQATLQRDGASTMAAWPAWPAGGRMQTVGS